MGLRLADGVEVARLETLGGCPLDRLLDLRAIERLIGEGWLTLDGGRIAATAAGRQRLEGILPMLPAAAAVPEAVRLTAW
jgi:coproporphyrinogen III oxidase-like Fe-S oxidoreductase